MAPMISIANEKDYQKMIKIADAVGIKYSVPNETSNWIYVPSINLEVAKERTLFGENFYDSQKELHSNNQKILTIPEFREFLKYAKENDKEVYNDITQVKSPWRAEWLDADFKVEGKNMVVYYHVFENGEIVKKSEKLDKNTLMQNKMPGISLENWLQDSTKQGLPKENINSGSLYYWAPMKDNNSVARFNAIGDRVYLDCNGNPSGRISYLGVRVAKLRE
ncbi:MAG: hypothetical protein KJ566_02585 [Nanoarchaeota archaeon]|nr:hypothetical protein [Nanoarchaeota archaeon]